MRVGLTRHTLRDPGRIQCVRVGTRVDHGRHLLADPVSSHWRHGVISDRAARRRRSFRGLLAAVATVVSGGVIPAGESCAIIIASALF